jgi:phasin family protein
MSEAMETLKTTTSTAMKDGFEKLQAAVADASAHGKANYEAFVTSGQTVAKGMEEVTAITTAYSKASWEKGMEAFKTLAATKSLQEVVEVQADYAKASLEAFLADFNKISDVMVATAKDAVKPLSERTSALVETMQGAK